MEEKLPDITPKKVNVKHLKDMTTLLKNKDHNKNPVENVSSDISKLSYND